MRNPLWGAFALLCVAALLGAARGVAVNCSLTTDFCDQLRSTVLLVDTTYTFDLQSNTTCSLACAVGAVDFTSIAGPGTIQIVVTSAVVTTLYVGGAATGTILLASTAGFSLTTPATIDVQFTKAAGLGFVSHSGAGGAAVAMTFALGKFSYGANGAGSALYLVRTLARPVISTFSMRIPVLTTFNPPDDGSIFSLVAGATASDYAIVNTAMELYGATTEVGRTYLDAIDATTSVRVQDGATVSFVNGFNRISYGAVQPTMASAIVHNITRATAIASVNIAFGGTSGKLTVYGGNVTTGYLFSGYNTTLALAVKASSFALVATALPSSTNLLLSDSGTFNGYLPTAMGLIDMSGPAFLGTASFYAADSVSSTVANLSAVCSTLSGATCNAGLTVDTLSRRRPRLASTRPGHWRCMASSARARRSRRRQCAPSRHG